MVIVFLSDTHNKLHLINVPDGDMLIVCGDFTLHSSVDEVRRFFEQLSQLPHRYKIVFAGNHELLFQREPDRARALVAEGIIYLQDSSVVVEGIRIYGSPWIPDYARTAFNLPVRSERLRDTWAKIPDDTDILITHGPPEGILDVVPKGNKHVGCPHLRDRVKVVKPRIHAFGHVHHSYGTVWLDGVLYINAASNTEKYEATNQAIVVNWLPVEAVAPSSEPDAAAPLAATTGDVVGAAAQ